MGKRVITWAGREKRRQTNKAVGGSFLKTLTELITNSDSAVKKQLNLPHAAGLVDQMLTLRVGDRVDSASLKKALPRRSEGRMVVEVYSKQHGQMFPSRTCQVIDYGPGMSEEELDRNFGEYAKAKAKGQRTRSLFGRGALDVFLYHSNQRRGDGVDPAAQVYSVKGGGLSLCRVYWGQAQGGEDDSIVETQTLGRVTPDLLRKYSLPPDLTHSGTVVRFLLADGTRIPQEGNFVAPIANFYMLRLIAADPAMRVLLRRYRTGGWIDERLAYDFDLGTVLLREQVQFQHPRVGEIPVDILVARSDRRMPYDPVNRERRENGLLFVDDDDAVLDLTLLPEYDKNPLLSRLYGIVRLTGIRAPLEALLEDRYPEAVLTETRDGLDPRNEIAASLFKLIERHLKPLYASEEKREHKGSGNRSAALDRMVKDALQELNKFHKDETDEGTGKPILKPNRPLSFSQAKIRLVAGEERRVTLYAQRDDIHPELNVVEISSDNPKIRVSPDSEVVRPRKGSEFQPISVSLACPIAGEKATITATAFSAKEEVLSEALEVTDVIEAQESVPPVDIEFRPAHYYGRPSVENHFVLLVNLDAFPGMPLVRFRIAAREGAVSLGAGRLERVEVKVEREHVIKGSRIAKILLPYWATAWGAKVTVEAKAKRADGRYALATCKADFREQSGKNQYDDIVYEPLDRLVLGEAALQFIYVNSKPPLHRILFGETQESFDKALEENPIGQMRVASIVTDAVVYDVASKKYRKGGEKGLTIGSEPISDVRSFVEAKRYELDSKIARAFLKDVTD
jgi:hypothetical protein